MFVFNLRFTYNALSIKRVVYGPPGIHKTILLYKTYELDVGVQLLFSTILVVTYNNWVVTIKFNTLDSGSIKTVSLLTDINELLSVELKTISLDLDSETETLKLLLKLNKFKRSRLLGP